MKSARASRVVRDASSFRPSRAARRRRRRRRAASRTAVRAHAAAGEHGASASSAAIASFREDFRLPSLKTFAGFMDAFLRFLLTAIGSSSSSSASASSSAAAAAASFFADGGGSLLLRLRGLRFFLRALLLFLRLGLGVLLRLLRRRGVLLRLGFLRGFRFLLLDFVRALVRLLLRLLRGVEVRARLRRGVRLVDLTEDVLVVADAGDLAQGLVRLERVRELLFGHCEEGRERRKA